MQIVRVQDLDDCLDTTLAKEIILAFPITPELIRYLGQEGDLDYYPDFPKPFFKVSCPGKYILQGIEGNLSIKVILEKEQSETNLANLKI